MGSKRVYEVVNNTPHKSSLSLDGQEFKYGRHGVFTVKDESVGKELKNRHDGFDAVVNEVEMSTNTEPGHNYTFTGISLRDSRGNERVKVRTEDGFTFMSRAVAEEEGYEILPEKREKRRKGAEVKDGG